MKSWAKKLETMITDDTQELTESEIKEMMDDLAQQTVDQFTIYHVPVSKLEELNHILNNTTRTLH